MIKKRIILMFAGLMAFASTSFAQQKVECTPEPTPLCTYNNVI